MQAHTPQMPRFLLWPLPPPPLPHPLPPLTSLCAAPPLTLPPAPSAPGETARCVQRREASHRVDNPLLSAWCSAGPAGLAHGETNAASDTKRGGANTACCGTGTHIPPTPLPHATPPTASAACIPYRIVRMRWRKAPAAAAHMGQCPACSSFGVFRRKPAHKLSLPYTSFLSLSLPPASSSTIPPPPPPSPPRPSLLPLSTHPLTHISVCTRMHARMHAPPRFLDCPLASLKSSLHAHTYTHMHTRIPRSLVVATKRPPSPLSAHT